VEGSPVGAVGAVVGAIGAIGAIGGTPFTTPAPTSAPKLNDGRSSLDGDPKENEVLVGAEDDLGGSPNIADEGCDIGVTIEPSDRVEGVDGVPNPDIEEGAPNANGGPLVEAGCFNFFASQEMGESSSSFF
jgi:hypothetical protein